MTTHVLQGEHDETPDRKRWCKNGCKQAVQRQWPVRAITTLHPRASHGQQVNNIIRRNREQGEETRYE